MFESRLFTELLLLITFQGSIIYFFLRVTLRECIKHYNIRRNGVHSTGEVIGATSEINVEGYEVFNAIIRFTDHQGLVRSFHTDFLFDRSPKHGMKARIIYNHSNPDEAYFNRRFDLFFLCLILIFLLGISGMLIRYIVVRLLQVL
jgi:hypothetical protein